MSKLLMKHDIFEWGNYGVEWEIDHIIPFELMNRYSVLARYTLNNYGNLAPKTHEQNRKERGGVLNWLLLVPTPTKVNVTKHCTISQLCSWTTCTSCLLRICVLIRFCTVHVFSSAHYVRKLIAYERKLFLLFKIYNIISCDLWFVWFVIYVICVVCDLWFVIGVICD